LHQEFQELNILNDITRLKYEGRLSHTVQGDVQNALIQLYCRTMTKEDDTDWHLVLRYKMEEELPKETMADNHWVPHMNSPKKRQNKTVIRKKQMLTNENEPECKKQKLPSILSRQALNPKGFIWDHEDYSCAYDSILTILLNIWTRNTPRWTEVLSRQSIYLNIFIDQLRYCQAHQHNLLRECQG
ncbi:hypothetical protein BDQ12DRAFT_618180, partial [Crucibulum laeve]